MREEPGPLIDKEEVRAAWRVRILPDVGLRHLRNTSGGSFRHDRVYFPVFRSSLRGDQADAAFSNPHENQRGPMRTNVLPGST